MKINRTLNAKRNSAWGILSKIFTLLLPFASRTVIIRYMGADYLGLNNVFTSVLSVLNLAELGIGSAIVYSMYKPIAIDDEDTICALLNLYKKIYRLIGIIIIGLGIALLPFLHFFINKGVPGDINIYILFFMYLLNTAASYLLFAYQSSLLHAHQRDDVISKVQIVFSILLNTLQIVTVILTKNYYYFVLIQLIITVLINIANAYASRKLYPQYRCSGRIDNGLKKDLKKRISGLMIIKIAAATRNSLDSIIVSAYLGLTAVAIYNNYYYIIASVQMILLVFMSAIAAGIGNSIAIDSKAKNLKDMNIINYLFMAISSYCMALIVCLYQPFMSLWVGDKLMLSDSVMWLFGIYFILLRIGDVQAQYFDAAGLWWNGKWRGVIEGTVNLILNIVLGKYFGLVGILIATIISIVLVNFPLSTYYTFKYYFNEGASKFVLEQSKNVVKAVIVSFVCWWVCSKIPISGLLVQGIGYMALRIGVCTCIFIILFVSLSFYEPLFKESRQWVKIRFFYK